MNCERHRAIHILAALRGSVVGQMNGVYEGILWDF